MLRPRRHLMRVVVFIAVVLVLAACGQTTAPSVAPGGSGQRSVSASPTPAQPPESGVYGVALIVGGPPPGTPCPGPYGIVVHEGHGLSGRVVARFGSDANGLFRISLPPGTYTLVQVSDCAVPQTVTVRPGQYANAELVIQAK